MPALRRAFPYTRAPSGGLSYYRTKSRVSGSLRAGVRRQGPANFICAPVASRPEGFLSYRKLLRISYKIKQAPARAGAAHRLAEKVRLSSPSSFSFWPRSLPSSQACPHHRQRRMRRTPEAQNRSCTACRRTRPCPPCMSSS